MMGKNYTQSEGNSYCDGSGEYNLKATKECTGRTSASTKLETDYSLKDKKRTSGDQD